MDKLDRIKVEKVDLELTYPNEECQGCSLTYFQIVRLTDEDVLNFLITHGVFRETFNCKKCGTLLKLNRNGLNFRCNKIHSRRKKKKERCNFKRSLRNNTILGRAKLSPKVYLDLVATVLHLNPPRFTFILENFGISSRTLADWSNSVRDVLIEHQHKHSSPLGGYGCVVEVDAANFEEGKFNRANREKEQWVLGGLERRSKELFLIPLKSPDALSILEAIEVRIQPGTTVVSDCFKSYRCWKEERYQKLIEKHSMTLLNPDHLNTTDSIKRLWPIVKEVMPLCGARRENFPGSLAEFYFKYTYPIKEVRLHMFLKEVARMYSSTY